MEWVQIQDRRAGGLRSQGASLCQNSCHWLGTVPPFAMDIVAFVWATQPTIDRHCVALGVTLQKPCKIGFASAPLGVKILHMSYRLCVIGICLA